MSTSYRTHLFVSYSHKDHEWLDRIRDLFAADKRNLRVGYWDDRELAPNDTWYQEILEAIDHAKVALLLVSPNFLASRFIMEEEVPRILKAREVEGLTVLVVRISGKFHGPDAPPAVAPLAEIQAATPVLAELSPEALQSTLIDLLHNVHRHLGRVGPPRNLPYGSIGTLFKGREEFLAQLHTRLSAESPGHTRAAAITAATMYGLGGIGKTRTAVEYAHRYADDYTALLFVQADSKDRLEANLAALCGPLVLDLAEHTARETEVQIAAALHWLEQHPGWFLILDNVDTDEAAKEVQALLARLAGAGKVVITSRLSAWGGGVEALALDVLAVEDASAFLLERTDKGRRKLADDAAQSRVLAVELGQLALALEQAGAYIVDDRATFAQYLEAWRKNHDRVIEWFDERIMQYPRSVAITWQTSFDRLGEPGRHLLRLLSWLAPDPIPESLLAAGDGPFGAEDESARPDARRALSELAKYSLVKRSDDQPTFSVHRLVQDVTRRTLAGDASLSSVKESLQWVNAAFAGNPQDVRSWSVLDPLVPHARSVADVADQQGVLEPTARLKNEVGMLLTAKAQYSEAEKLYRRALAIFESSYGPNHPNVATNLSNLALLLQATNRLAEAEPLMRRGLAIDESSSGPDHPNVARDLSNLAQLLQATNRLAEAEPLMRRALGIDESSYGPDHPDVARDLSNLAQLLQATNRLAEAEPLYRRALGIFESSYGPNHPNVAIDLNNLAQLLQATNRLAEAEPLMRRALGIFVAFSRATGHPHPHLQAVANNYAGLLDAMGRSEDEIRAALREVGPEFFPE